MNNKGFTLIELIAVIIIIASICALALPNSGKILSNIKVRSTVRQICALLNYARGQAVIHGANYKVNCNEKEKSCWITKKTNDDYVRLKGREGKTLFIPQEISFQTEIDSVTFYPKGISSGGEIFVEDFRIVVDEVTGVVEVLNVKQRKES
ncbi:MAG: prepilin-type N-terminal cleavage/methylation domain-containing protein [bacterium]